MAIPYEIINSQVIFAYQRNLDIRKRQFEFEDSLKGLFNIPFNNFAIADDQDGNIPRFEGSSIHGFSRLQVSQFSTYLITNFQDEYRTDVETIKAYLSERVKILKNLVSVEKNKFAAFVIEIGYEFQSEKEVNSFLKSNVGARCLNDKTNDFSIFYSQEYKDKYFLNIKCSKYSEGPAKIIDGEIVPDGEQKKGISIILDINSKLSFRNGDFYNDETLNLLEKETFEILSSYTLEDYLTGNII